MGKKIDAILHPKHEGLTAGKKPVALVVHSPNDEQSASTRYLTTVESVRTEGYGTISKGQLTFDKTDAKSFEKTIKPVQKESLTIWLESPRVANSATVLFVDYKSCQK